MRLGQRVAKLEARSPFGARNLVIVLEGAETEGEALRLRGIDRLYPEDQVLFVHIEKPLAEEATTCLH